ncbi:MAG: sugar isomerase [Rhodospirillales bacterium RIFCSPLOWO2_12_FULL_58_28]|nr:MAG: sugar isomerase [Rhodospirillales bacterium RIFCSPLOWO2_02_FULL_58_16]OHC79327.1 MAG: sugar isomerase [Rhodospirillales bacterium RIFCSPLOWO2_12_FULL_58_28]
MGHVKDFLKQTAEIAAAIDPQSVERMAVALKGLRERRGRLFLVGVGGGAANCSHAVNDFRKLCAIEAYTPVDNVSELTARTNDEGWETVYSAWLETSRADRNDALMVFSVGGGDLERNVSANIVQAVKFAKARAMTVLGVVGRDGGYTKSAGDEVVVIPTVAPNHITPHAEAFQAVVWHCLVSHPDLAVKSAKWEGLDSGKAV